MSGLGGGAVWPESNNFYAVVFMPGDGVLVAGMVVDGRYADAVMVFGTVGHPCVADPEVTDA